MEGRRLTEQHKAAQVRLAGLAAMLTVANGKRLDVADLDGSMPDWLARQALILDGMRLKSRRLAAAYVVAFRAAEGYAPADVVEPVLPSVAEVAGWVVPTIKAAIRDGR